MGLLDRLRRALGSEAEKPATSAEVRTLDPPRIRVEVQRVTEPMTVDGGEDEDARDAPYESRYLSAAEAAELLLPGDDGVIPVRIRDGFFQHIPSGKYVPAANRTLNKHGLVSFGVRGARYYQSKAADTRPGQVAHLVREPDNEHDPHAVAVHALGRDGQRLKVGYVNKGLARRLAKRLDAGEELSAYFMRGYPPGVDEASPAVVLADDATVRRLVDR